MTGVLLDTGPIVALLDRRERYHEKCAAAVRGLRRPLLTCEAVIAEACYLLRGVSGAPEAILENVAQRVFQMPLRPADCAVGVGAVLRKYRDRHIDLADACLVHLAKAAGTGDILTLNRDFHVYRWSGNKPFRLLLDLPQEKRARPESRRS